jgi:hypothetical protein
MRDRAWAAAAVLLLGGLLAALALRPWADPPAPRDPMPETRLRVEAVRAEPDAPPSPTP